MQWQEIVKFLGGASVFGAVIAYLGKISIDAFVSCRIESYKKDLERIAAEDNVRFQRLHAERADCIKTFYGKLSQLDEVLSSTLAPFQSVDEARLVDKVQLMSKHFNETREYFVPRRIFFDDPTCEQVDRVLNVARGIFFDITVYEIDLLHPQYKYDPSVILERHEFWEKARTSHKNDFSPLKKNLEAQLRSTLGIGAKFLSSPDTTQYNGISLQKPTSPSAKLRLLRFVWRLWRK
jgi:hypothetical protein